EIGDLNDRAKLTEVLRQYKIDTVMHFAAYAYVGESVEQPLMYYHNNVATTINVLRAMGDAGVRRFVFSSTCAVYGDPTKVPITEDERKAPVSPYGRSKLMVEQILADAAAADKQFQFAALRYFNASGCAPDGAIGEDHRPETHLIPVVLQAILGVRPGITVFGTDYPTPDGTNVRDYIHVDDLADAHILAMEKLSGEPIYCNLGTGRGFSVREIISTCEKVTEKKAPVTFGARRAGTRLRCTPMQAARRSCWDGRRNIGSRRRSFDRRGTGLRSIRAGMNDWLDFFCPQFFQCGLFDLADALA
ncbi:MAG TPA: UDP-glucose 4-epimerase GalE, partial [Tepidisphaeraceae bacterium]|nr:UDP-glucose 4-epimerase GalE [Tepidisphaeraceae bacterium]